jgi:glycosyltransferase involved in cell wall biosynthesis
MTCLSLISIILPTYNRAAWLIKSMGSVINQTYSNWEMIVWDDGSNDNTEEVVKSFHDERIKYYKGFNKGAAFARNRALEKSIGNYIAFLDSDDEWVSDKLGRQVEILDKYPYIDFLFGNYLNIDLSTGVKGLAFDQFELGLHNLQVSLIESTLFAIYQGMPESLFIANFIATDSVLVRKTAVDLAGKFNETLCNAEDLEYWWRMGLHGVNFAYVDDILMVRNKPPDSLSSSSISTNHNSLRALDLCRIEALKNGRANLVKYLMKSYRFNWLMLSQQHAAQKNVKQAITAFFNSLKFGINRDTIYVVAKLVFGNAVVNQVKKIAKKTSLTFP